MTISELAVVDITITPVNDPPTVRFQQSQFTGDENVPLLITGITVGDVEANADQTPVSVVLSVDAGILMLPTMDSAVQISGNGTSQITLAGTTSAINLLLSEGVTFQPDPDFSGQASLTVTIADSLDPSVALSATGSVFIDILSPSQQAMAFQDQIAGLLQNGGLSKNVGQKLLVSLNGQLNTYHIQQTIQQIMKMAQKGQIDPDLAQQFIDQLNTLNQGL